MPSNFSGGENETLNVTHVINQIVHLMDLASAKAQGLVTARPSTSKVKSTNKFTYFMVDKSANGDKGALIGMLKTGDAPLCLCNKRGECVQVKARCVLDFFVIESYQRAGFGRSLFQYMLAYEELDPEGIAFEKPTSQLLEFLGKHYDLKKRIKQDNKFVIFDGFFDRNVMMQCNKLFTKQLPRTASRSYVDPCVAKVNGTFLYGEIPEPESKFKRAIQRVKPKPFDADALNDQMLRRRVIRTAAQKRCVQSARPSSEGTRKQQEILKKNTPRTTRSAGISRRPGSARPIKNQDPATAKEPFLAKRVLHREDDPVCASDVFMPRRVLHKDDDPIKPVQNDWYKTFDRYKGQ